LFGSFSYCVIETHSSSDSVWSSVTKPDVEVETQGSPFGLSTEANWLEINAPGVTTSGVSAKSVLVKSNNIFNMIVYFVFTLAIYA
jgi:hypothetical protein